MANQDPIPLSNPRSPSHDEAAWVRDQARVWYAIDGKGSDPFHTLIRACEFCGSDDLVLIYHDLTAVCQHCGKRLSMMEPFPAGRISRR